MGKNYQKAINDANKRIDKLQESMAAKEYNGDTVYGDVQTLIAGFRLYQEVLQMVNNNVRQQQSQVQPIVRENQYLMRFQKEMEMEEKYKSWKDDTVKKEEEAQKKVNEEAQKRMKEQQDGTTDTPATTPDSTGDKPTNEGDGDKQPDTDPR